MRRRHLPAAEPDPSAIDGALSAMNADQLRELVRDILPWLDNPTHGRVVNRLIDRAARGEPGWAPPRPSKSNVAGIVSFAEAARHVGSADPSDVDGYLRQGSSAFLSKDYAAAYSIFRALLIPIGDCEIDLGQHELVDEVLGAEVADCAAQYVVSMYMTAVPDRRPEAVRKALSEVRGIGYLWEPLREMERVAVEPLPQFDDFLPRWRAAVEDEAVRPRRRDWDTDENRWLREVVRRIEGAEGLGRVARLTRRAEDLRAWCGVLLETGDWKAALSAYEEAAEIVTEKAFWRGEFLDGAALTAQELGRKDLPARLERAWREAPSMLRLRRWMGSAESRAAVRKRAGEALEACPTKAHRQRAFLHVLVGDLNEAAKLLSDAPGLGWSDSEHPGHLLFPVFSGILRDDGPGPGSDPGPHTDRWTKFEEREWTISEREGPHLETPGIDDVCKMAGVGGGVTEEARSAMLQAMRKVAENRLAGVVSCKRRRHYGHAALLVGTCAALDPAPDAADWVAKIRAEYRRYPALQRELDEAL